MPWDSRSPSPPHHPPGSNPTSSWRTTNGRDVTSRDRGTTGQVPGKITYSSRHKPTLTIIQVEARAKQEAVKQEGEVKVKPEQTWTRMKRERDPEMDEIMGSARSQKVPRIEQDQDQVIDLTGL